MASNLHFILIFSGLWTLALCASRQFYVVEKPLNWTQAQEYCRVNYTDLATIENNEEMNTVKAQLQRKTSNFWIGLKQNQTHENRNQNWSWTDGASFNYTNWNEKEPNNNGSNNCVELCKDNNYNWNDAKCHHNTSFICYKKQTPLIVINQNKTWHEALKFCRQNHVDLVSVSSEEEQKWVETVFTNNPHNSTDVWLGLRHTSALGFWYWVTGEMICYQNWAHGNGTRVEDCGDGERTGAMLSSNKKWVSLPETQKLPFICITF